MILTWLVGCEGDIGHSCTFGTTLKTGGKKKRRKKKKKTRKNEKKKWRSFEFPLNLSDHIATSIRSPQAQPGVQRVAMTARVVICGIACVLAAPPQVLAAGEEAWLNCMPHTVQSYTSLQ
jgi:hypothetical protein